MALMPTPATPTTRPRSLAPFRALAEPIADLLQPMPYAEIFPPEDPSYQPVASNRTFFIDHVDDALAQLIIDRVEEHLRRRPLRRGPAPGPRRRGRPGPGRRDRLRPSGRPDHGQRGRDRRDQDDLPAHGPWLDAFADELRGDDHRAYVNFLVDEGPDASPRRLPGPDVGSAGGHQAPLRPREPVPPQPERAARVDLVQLDGSRRRSGGRRPR